MIVSFNTDTNLDHRHNKLFQRKNLIFKGGLHPKIKQPVLKSDKSFVKNTAENSMTATEVLKYLRQLEKRFKNNWEALSEYQISQYIKYFDLDNARRHLANLESLLEVNSSRISYACTNGYFSSPEGADALEFIMKHFNTESANKTISPMNSAMSALLPNEALNIRDRALIKFENNNQWSEKIENLAKLSDEEYARYLESGQDDIFYLSENKKINKLLKLLVKNKDSTYGISVNELRFYDNIIKKDLLSNPDKEDSIMKFYTQLAKDRDYKSHKLKEIFSDPENLNLFKKAYRYIENNCMNGAKPMIIRDPVSANYHKAGGIIDFSDTKPKKTFWKHVFFDGEGNFIRYNSVINKDSKVTEYVATPNSRRIFNAKLKQNDKDIFLLESKKEILDSKGNLICAESYVKSKDVPNKYDIYREFPNGEKYKIGLAERSENGNVIIEKTFTTSKGIKTDYNYVETPEGSRLSYTRIRDAKGNVIVENKYKYQILDEEHFKTTENGTKYYIQYNNSTLGTYARVTIPDGRNTILFIGGNSELAPGILSKELLPLLKRMPGSFYFDIDRHNLKKVGLDINKVLPDSAHYNSGDNVIALSKKLRDSDFTLAHEFGHYRNKYKKISENPDVIECYLKEREAFMTNETRYETFSTNYMIDACSRTTDNFIGSLEELIAEVNAFLYASNDNPLLEIRGQYIQEHFPETFAKIAKLLLN